MSVRSGVCIYCECTDTNACEEGCAWTDATATLCTVCQRAEILAKQLVEIVGYTRELPGGPPVPPVAWDRFTLEHQALLVACARRTLTAALENYVVNLSEAAAGAIDEFDTLARFLGERFPKECESAHEPLSEIVMRLLAPSAESRIILPASSGGR